jgi:hypothetical protein
MTGAALPPPLAPVAQSRAEVVTAAHGIRECTDDDRKDHHEHPREPVGVLSVVGHGCNLRSIIGLM